MANSDAQIHEDAELIYNYHRMNMATSPADTIFCLCSLDTRVAQRAAQLWLAGLAPLLIFSGDSGKLTAGRFIKTEAEEFADIARGMGVPSDRIIVEPRATNTGENVRFTHALLRDLGIQQPKRLILVQKPYMERRTFATFKKQWPDGGAAFSVTSPAFTFDEYPDGDNPRELVINIMVGDLVRIRDYPAKGFQVEQHIPGEVWEAMERLVRAGYDKHLPEGFAVGA
ncbi:hypothetical protein QQS21_007783 [Conoideocrella luteorostrata]|uniref:DUF218 domain-containing protein n=1 Tax=Conoideocrella luteorostrata TaxID=1105319 RepID=A0AAJ0CMW1_9HYPO|nr:hypothetical protein QQS21_007783 [Conoideocrella luteorostrata]